MVLIRVRSREGVERVSIDNPNITIGELKTLIESEFDYLNFNTKIC
ncbi:unnamed protein product [Amaranthus hypochondriacus]